MTPRPKQIVIDKSAFQGIRLDALCDFAAGHLVIVPDVLCYECHTCDTNPYRSLAACEKVIRAGGHYCTCSTGFIRSEGCSLSPYPLYLADSEITSRIREGGCGWQEIDAGRLWEDRSNAARKMLVDSVKTISEKAMANFSALATDIGQLPMDTKDRLGVFLCRAETEMHDFAVRSVRTCWIKGPDKFCLSREWMSWQYFRLLRTCVMDNCCRAIAGGLVGGTRAEHDYQDMEYVLLLSRADGIITRDKKLVEPLARAAFAEKDVFSSLEEVPESYRCDWDHG